MLNYLKKEKVLTISLILALVSMFFVHPDSGYLEYIDLHVLALLFCLMLLIKGFEEMGVFDLLIRHVELQGRYGGRHSIAGRCAAS